MGVPPQGGLQPATQGPLEQVHNERRIPLVDVGTLKLIQQGEIHVRPGVERFKDNQVIFTDGRGEAYDAVILATGFRPGVDAFIQEKLAFDGSGTPTCSGCEAPIPGLYIADFTCLQRECCTRSDKKRAGSLQRSPRNNLEWQTSRGQACLTPALFPIDLLCAVCGGY